MKRVLVAGLILGAVPVLLNRQAQIGLALYRASMVLNPGLAHATTAAAEMMAQRMVASGALVVKRQTNAKWQ